MAAYVRVSRIVARDILPHKLLTQWPTTDTQAYTASFRVT